jgi:DNA-binding XRE family transcriptional regulator
MKIYISGAITNNPNYKEDFERAEDYLQREYPSAEIINPALVNSFLPKSTTHEEYMRMSFCMLDMCDTIFMIRGWEDSKGANQEYRYALLNNKTILIDKELDVRKGVDVVKTGNNLKAIRKSKKIKVIDATNALELYSPQAIYKWERGECLPRVDTYIALCDLYGIEDCRQPIAYVDSETN